MKKITAKDIAAECGIGKSTVSLILNGHGERLKVSRELCERVMHTAKRMGYRPNELAVSVSKGYHRMIAYVVTTMKSSYEMEELSGVNRACAENGYALRIFTPSDQSLEEIAGQIIGGMIAGVVASLSCDMFAILKQHLEPYSIPITSSGLTSATFGVSVFTTDDKTEAAKVADLFYEMGHRRIGLCYTKPAMGFRYIGFRKRIAQLPVDQDDSLILGVSYNMEWNSGDAELVADYVRNVRPTAVFCDADPLAMRFLSYAQEAGARIPQDISVIGYADLDYAKFSTPPLSTVRTPFDKMGYGAANLLFEEINDTGKAGRTVFVPCTYIERKSTRKLKLDSPNSRKRKLRT